MSGGKLYYKQLRKRASGESACMCVCVCVIPPKMSIAKALGHAQRASLWKRMTACCPMWVKCESNYFKC